MENLHDAYLQRAVRLARVADSESVKIANGLKELHTRILKRIAAEYGDMSAARLKTLNSVIEDLLIAYYRDNVSMSLEDMAKDVIQKEIMWNFAVLAEATGQRLVKPIMKEAAKSALLKPYQGRAFKTWFEDAGVTNSSRITKLLTENYLKGESTGAAVRDVFSVTQRAEADIKTLSRSFFMHMSVEARDKSLETYGEYIGGMVWSSILDNRTTPTICGIRDQLKYDDQHNPIGHDIPWGAGPGRIHFNCRSQAVPFLKGEQLPTMNRAAVNAGENYERGDKTTDSGKVRKPTKANRESGIYDVEMVTTRTKYEGWLRSQPTPFIADVLGSVEKARDFKGGTSLKSFLPDSGPGSLGVINNIGVSNL